MDDFNVKGHYGHIYPFTNYSGKHTLSLKLNLVGKVHLFLRQDKLFAHVFTQ